MTKQKAKTARAPAELVQIYETRMIPLNLLDVDEANVRLIKNGVSIEMLADDIGLRSLLQSLNVRTTNDEGGKPTGRFGVKAGGRRLKALQLLAKQKRIEPDQPIPCIVKDAGNAADDSLAENVFREDLHPLDQFRAFKTLADQGQSDTQIAGTYHVTEKFVKQRLKLAAASPKLLKAYQDADITLEHLEAFCVTDDHKRQDQVFKALKNGHAFHAHAIRRALTETTVEASDPRALFVGLDAYQAAGGTIMEDLFKDESGPWLQNPELLQTLAAEKIEAERDVILALGFKWAEISLDPDNVFDLKRNLSAIPNLPTSLTKDEKAELQNLAVEFDALIEKREWGDEDEPFTGEDAARLADIVPIIAEMKNRAPKLGKKQTARSGVIISLDDNGALSVEYGFLKPEDCKLDKKAAAADPDPDGTDGDDDDEGYVPANNNPAAIAADKPLADSFVRDITSYRTVALQNALAQDFNTAFLAALHALCSSIFCHQSYSTAIKISPQQQYFRGVVGLEDWDTFKEIQARHEQWGERIPGDAKALWPALEALSTAERADLFAHCVSLTVDAVHGNQSRPSSAGHSDQLAVALSLDMKSAGWISTAETYFSRLKKAQIVEAVKEAKGPHIAAQIDYLKKPVMAKEAERIVKDTDWLPPLLRAPNAPAFAAEPEEAGDQTVSDAPKALPEFLDGGHNGASSAQAA